MKGLGRVGTRPIIRDSETPAANGITSGLRGGQIGVYARPDVLYSSACAGEQGNTAKGDEGHEQRVFDHVLCIFFFTELCDEGAKCVHVSLIGAGWKLGVSVVLSSTTITLEKTV